MKFISAIISFVILITSCQSENKSNDLLIELDGKIQKLNKISHYEGDQYMQEYELEFRNDNGENETLINARKYIYLHLMEIDSCAGKTIQTIDQTKIAILKYAGENTKFKDDNYHIVQSPNEYDAENPSLPMDFCLKNIKNKNQKIDMGLFLDNKNKPTKLSKKLWNELHKTRKNLILTVCNYHWFDADFKFGKYNFNSNAPIDIQKFKFKFYVENCSKLNLEDKYGVINIFNILAFDENYSTCERWLRANFEDLTILEAITKLNSMQNAIIDARHEAIVCWCIKITHCGSAFDISLPYSSSKTNINLGDSLQIKVTLVGFRSTGEMNVSVNDKNASINYKDGMGYVNVKPTHKGLNTYSGETVMYFGSGRKLKRNWTWTVNVN